jgi:hypothetical protein
MRPVAVEREHDEQFGVQARGGNLRGGQPLDCGMESLAKLHESISPRRHGGTEKNKGKSEEARVFIMSTELFFSAGMRRAALGLDGRGCPSPHEPYTTRALHHARRLLLHLLRLIMGDQRVDDWLQLAIHYLLELVNGEADAMIGEPVLGKIVGANLFGAVA